MTLAGNLRQVALPEVLRSIESGQQTGRLLLERGQLRAEIYFAGGQWLLAERSGDATPFAYHLAHAGLIDAEQFQMATGVPLAHAGMMPDVQAARMLISARVLTQEQLRQWALSDAIGLLGVVLAWPDGDFIFDEGTPVPQGRIVLPLPVTPMLAQAMRAVRGAPPPPHEVAPLAPDLVIDFAEMDAHADGTIHVTREQWRLLTMVDGQMPLWGIAQALQAPEPVILRLAGELAAMGILVIVGSVTPAGMESFA